MRKLERFDIMDYVLYEERRAELVQSIIKIKEPRRIFVGDKLLMLFENVEMVRHHVLETIRMEKLFSEHDLLRQLEIFNPLIAGPGELRCTMIILGHTAWDKPKKMKSLEEFAEHIYVVLNDGKKVYAQLVENAGVNQHPGTLRVLRFFCGNQYPIRIGSDYNNYKLERRLNLLQQAALREDLHIAPETARENMQKGLF